MKIANRKYIKPFTTLDGSIIRELLAYRNSKLKNLSLAEAVVPYGKQTVLHFHKKAQEIYYILRGKGRMYIERESIVVEKGDAILIMPNQKHKIKNIGSSILVFLCICSPCYEHKDTKINGQT